MICKYDDCLKPSRDLGWCTKHAFRYRRHGDPGIVMRPRWKLTPEHVRTIRRRYAAGGISLAELGREYGVSRQTIHHIVTGVTWPGIEH